MKHYYEDGGLRLFHGSNKDILPTFDAESFDSIVTDPPYELGFMGKGWDSSGIAYDVEMWRECWRVLKPGGYLLAFGGTRTWHRIATAIEDAGFEIRDSVAWLYGSGFPKSMDVSKAIDKQRHELDEIYEVTGWIRSARDRAQISNRVIDQHFGANGMGRHWTDVLPGGKQPAVPTLEQVPDLLTLLGVEDADVPERIAHLLFDLNGKKGTPGAGWLSREVTGKHESGLGVGASGVGGSGEGKARRDHAATDAAREWEGWGTALKPAFEPIIVARKPLGEKTVAANVLAHGTGALNIDATRIAGGSTKRRNAAEMGYHGGNVSTDYETGSDSGRWPANVALDESQAAALDEQAPKTGAAAKASGPTLRGETGGTVAYGARNGLEGEPSFHGDIGGASRFFPTFRYEAKAPSSERPEVDGVAHATVKPLDLMRWLVRLVTRRGGRVLDPFAGSGTTGEAALLEGMEVDLIELEADHLPLILQRVRKPLQPSMFD